MGCIFCSIGKGDLPSNKIYEDETMLAFYDIDPKAPVHFLVISKKHIDSIDDIDEADSKLISKMFYSISKLSKELGLEKGYRVVTNIGKDGGQTVNHMHFHVLGGRSLQWPPG